MSQTDGFESFASYIQHMHDKGRSIAAYVEGDLAREPPVGRHAAKTVALKLNDESEEIVRMQPGDVTNEAAQQPESVGTILVTLPPETTPDAWHPVQQRLLSRVPRDTDIVVLVDTNDVPWFVNDLCDIRIVATEIETEPECYRVRVDHWDGEPYYTELPFSEDIDA